MRDKPQSHSSREHGPKTGAHKKSREPLSHSPRRSQQKTKPENASRELGQTSDEYGMIPDPLSEMPPGDEIAFVNPDIQQIGPPGGAAYERGFGDQSWRRDH